MKIRKVVSCLSLILLTVHVSGCASDVSASTVDELVNYLIPEQAGQQEQQVEEQQEQPVPRNDYYSDTAPLPDQNSQEYYASQQPPAIDPPPPQPSEPPQSHMINTFGDRVEGVYVISVPMGSNFEEVRPLDSERPFVRYVTGNDRYAYSSFIVTEEEEPQTTIDNVIKSLKFEQITDESSCNDGTPDVICHEYRAYNPSRKRVYLGRVYIVKDPSQVYTGHSLVFSTSDDTEINDRRFVASLRLKSRNVIAKCHEVVDILTTELKETIAGSADDATRVNELGAAASRLKEFEPVDNEFDKLLGNLTNAYATAHYVLDVFLQTAGNTNNIASYNAPIVHNSNKFDEYCFQ